MTRLALLRVGLLAALLALAGQLAWGATVPDPALAKIGFGVICHSGQHRQPPTSPPHRASDCLLCPLCLAYSMPLPPPANPPSVPAPRVAAVAPDVRLPSATTPPVTRPVAAQPRGPPSLA